MKVSEIEVGGVYGDGEGNYRCPQAATGSLLRYTSAEVDQGFLDAAGEVDWVALKAAGYRTTGEGFCLCTTMAAWATARDKHPPQALLDALKDRP